jgi:hypothetical protein
MNVFASIRELACHAQQRDAHASRYDIKQKTNRVYLPRSREAVFPVFLEMPDMHTSQRCCTRKKRPGPAVVMRSLTKEIAEITKD